MAQVLNTQADLAKYIELTGRKSTGVYVTPRKLTKRQRKRIKGMNAATYWESKQQKGLNDRKVPGKAGWIYRHGIAGAYGPYVNPENYK